MKGELPFVSLLVHVLRGASKILDLSYITTRILVMPFPYEDSSRGNSLDEVSMLVGNGARSEWFFVTVFRNVQVREFLDEHHPSQYLVFNVSGEDYDTAKLHGQVRPAGTSWAERVMIPPLSVSHRSWLVLQTVVLLDTPFRCTTSYSNGLLDSVSYPLACSFIFSNQCFLCLVQHVLSSSALSDWC